jgi:hypothetical protein
MPLVVATFNESKPAAMGMRTEWLRSIKGSGRPSPSDPNSRAARGGRVSLFSVVLPRGLRAMAEKPWSASRARRSVPAVRRAKGMR